VFSRLRHRPGNPAGLHGRERHHTSELCGTEIHLANRIAITDEQSATYKAFRRVWSQPTDEETQHVGQWAGRIARDPHKSFAWKKGGIN
jgi:hypothetical protein